MTRDEYESYRAAVAAFMEREGIRNLSSGPSRCPECGSELEDGNCQTHGLVNEPFFSWRPCDCCGTSLGGNREHATGWNPTKKQVQEYTICEDCVYYAEYGRLDDQAMAERA